MKCIVCLSFVFLFTAVLECDSHWASPRKQSRRPGFFSNAYGGYRPTSCRGRGCPNGYGCRRSIRATLHPVARCLPDIRAAIRRRLDIFERAFNTRNLQAAENLFTVDTLILHANNPIMRGRAGYAEFLAGLIAQLNWDQLTWIIDTVKVGTDDFVSTVIFFEITSSLANGATSFGKASMLWRRRRNVYEIDVFTYNSDM